MDERQTRITAAARSLPRPDDVLALARQRFDGAAGRLTQALRANLNVQRGAYERVSARLSTRSLSGQIALHREALDRHNLQATRAIRRNCEAKSTSLAASKKLLASLSYESVVQRGFAVVRDTEGTLLDTAEAARKAGHLSLQFRDDSVEANVGGTATGKPKGKPAQTKPASGSSQGNLF